MSVLTVGSLRPSSAVDVTSGVPSGSPSAGRIDGRIDTSVGSPASPTSIDVGATLAVFRHGAGDPTTQLTRVGHRGTFARATHTPDGPATLLLRWSGPLDATRQDGTIAGLDADAWGPGSEWILGRAAAMVGIDDLGAGALSESPDRAVAEAARATRMLRLGASADLYHELLPTILEQRITSGEAKRQWRRLCLRLGDPAPGPVPGLRLPPAPETLARRAGWWFHPLGIERGRARTLAEVARHPGKLWEWAGRSPEEADVLLRRLTGVGVWTSGRVRGAALGDPDAVPVGDFHVKHLVGWALAGEPRASDERMLELLEPYAGQRGRVVRMLKATIGRAPAFGPRQRVLPIHAW